MKIQTTELWNLLNTAMGKGGVPPVPTIRLPTGKGKASTRRYKNSVKELEDCKENVQMLIAERDELHKYEHGELPLPPHFVEAKERAEVYGAWLVDQLSKLDTDIQFEKKNGRQLYNLSTLVKFLQGSWNDTLEG
jgi:hypothetical protein